MQRLEEVKNKRDAQEHLENEKFIQEQRDKTVLDQMRKEANQDRIKKLEEERKKKRR